MKVQKTIKTMLTNLTALITVLFIVSIFAWGVGFIYTGIFAETELVTTSDVKIYQLWQNQYQTVSSGKTHTVSEIDRYYYKIKQNDAYYDCWANFNISSISIIDDSIDEHAVTEKLMYKKRKLGVYFGEPSGSIDYPDTQVHFYIHKSSAVNLGININ